MVISPVATNFFIEAKRSEILPLLYEVLYNGIPGARGVHKQHVWWAFSLISRSCTGLSKDLKLIVYGLQTLLYLLLRRRTMQGANFSTCRDHRCYSLHRPAQALFTEMVTGLCQSDLHGQSVSTTKNTIRSVFETPWAKPRTSSYIPRPIACSKWWGRWLWPESFGSKWLLKCLNQVKVVQKAVNEGAQCRLCLPNLEAEGKVSYGRLDCQKLYERPGSIP